MVNIWLIYGLYMVNIWSVYGLYMVFQKFGIYMGKVWGNYDKSMGHIFMDNQYETFIYALYMGNTLFGESNDRTSNYMY
jgi:hypothetical protein